MTKALASLTSLALVVALAATGVLACPCSAGPAAGEASSPCHQSESGLAAAPMSCGCACLAAAPAERPAPRTEPLVTATASLHQDAPVQMTMGSERLAATFALASSPPAPPRHRILRI